MWAPALYTFLAMTWGAAGWLVIAAIVVVATAGLHPSARRAQRFLREHGVDPDDSAADDADEQATPVPPPSLLQEPPLAPATGGIGPTTAPDARDRAADGRQVRCESCSSSDGADWSGGRSPRRR